MAEAGFDAVLVGEALVRSDDPGALVAGTECADGREREGDDVSRFELGADRMPTAWFNVAARSRPSRCSRRCTRATREPIGPDDLAPLFPMALIAQEVADRPVDRHPGRGARHPAPVAADAARARRPARGGARHAGAHLLQGRVGVARGVAQAEHRGAAGLLQQGRGHPAAGDRDRRRPVGDRAVVRVHASSTSSARSTWCGRRTSRSRTGG